MNSESEGIKINLNKIEYGKWYWDAGLDRPVFTLYPYTDTRIACLCPVIKFDKGVGLVWEPVKKEHIVRIMVNPAPLDY